MHSDYKTNIGLIFSGSSALLGAWRIYLTYYPPTSTVDNNFTSWFSQISPWVYIPLFIISLVVLLFLFYKIFFKKNIVFDTSYNKDNFDGVVWSWNKHQFLNEINGLEAQCPRCRTPLTQTDFPKSKFRHFCTTCNMFFNLPTGVFEYNYDGYLHTINKRILGIYNSGKWKERINKKYLKKNDLI